MDETTQTTTAQEAQAALETLKVFAAEQVAAYEEKGELSYAAAQAADKLPAALEALEASLEAYLE